MEFGLHLPHVGPFAAREVVLGMARAADAAGVDSLWVSDHVVVPRDYASRYPYAPSGKMPVPEDAPFLEAVATLLAVSGVTERARLGTSVLVLPQRQPVLVAKQWATLDVLSGGRTIFGVGVGWLAEESAALGVPFARRGSRCEEALRLIEKCWAEDSVTFTGEHFRVERLACEPKPLQKPRPPIWIGGHTPAAFRRVARFGDAWHGNGTAELCSSGMAAIRAEAEKSGRDPATISLTIRDGKLLDVSTREARERTVERLLPYVELGATHFVFLSLSQPEAIADVVETLNRDVKPALE